MLGVAESNVNLIAEIDDKEMIDAMNLYADQHNQTKKPRTFSDVLDLFMPKKNSGTGQNSKPKNAFEDGVSRQVLDSLKRQSERLGKE